MFCKNHKTTLSDVMIVLGDAGINLSLNKNDRKLKKMLVKLPIQILCIVGNHEERPFNIVSYIEKSWHGGTVYVEPEFSNLLFAKDGEIYDFDAMKAIAIGGAYSVGKEFCLMSRVPWFESEQPTDEIKAYVEMQLEN